MGWDIRSRSAVYWHVRRAASVAAGRQHFDVPDTLNVLDASESFWHVESGADAHGGRFVRRHVGTRLPCCQHARGANAEIATHLHQLPLRRLDML